MEAAKRWESLGAAVPALTDLVINIDNWCFTLPEVLAPRQEASSVPGQVLDPGTWNGRERCWGERPYRLLVAPVQLLAGGVQEAAVGKNKIQILCYCS